MKSSANTAKADALRQQLHYRLKEAALIALGALCIYFWMALLSYSPMDPGIDVSTSAGQVQNAAGRVGAWVASFFLFGFGYSAYLLPLLMGIKVLELFRTRHEPFRWNGWLFSWRIIGLFFLLISTAALASIQFQALEMNPQAPAGGILGKSLGEWAEDALNVQGSTLMFIALFLFGLTVFTDLSWFRVMDLTGKITLDLFELIQGAGHRWWAGRQTHRQLKLKLRESDEAVEPAAEPVAGQPRATVSAPAAKAAVARGAPAAPVARAVLAGVTSVSVRPPAAAAERIEPVVDLSVVDDEPEPMPPQPVEAKPMLAAIAEAVTDALSAVTPARPGPEREEVRTEIEPAVPWAEQRTVVEVKPAEVRRPIEPPKPVVHYIDDAVAGTLPPLSLLDPPQVKPTSFSPESLESMSRLLEIKLKEFGVEVQVVDAHPGPVITRFEIQPAAGIKVSRITNLAKDLARSLAVISVRVVEVIPGKTTVGIEIPNENRQIVRFSEVLSTPEYEEAQSPVTIALGHDIGGRPVTADLAKMPHLLVAGTTGSGKSVGVNAMLLSILYKSTPDQVRLIMIDPKMLELSIYEGIPHLLCPVVTDMKEAANALRWSVAEMDRRYRLMAAMGVRNLAGFNRKIKDAEEAGAPLTDPLFRRESPDDEVPLLKALPTIVVVVDEFADMIMIVGKKVEELIARIAQKARAAGIHLILATQRPSVDVITGLIKANIPTRIAFQVSSKIDSRTILDQGGAEQLLGHGDMLYLPPGSGLPIRVHGAFVSDDEVHRSVDAWKQRGAPDYIQDILAGADEGGGGSYDSTGGDSGEGSEEDPLYDEAVRFVTESRRASISAVQRKLKIGYNRAARMIEAMEMAGVVTSMNTNGSREVIAPTPVRD
ncbi:DNA translocase FtsK 4TM domain-containing protein [Pseudomonas sp. MAP12]|uniref:DNA translocase FtsK n=1 Tax=Geopseudomonas aromaticivorans TaxID=2849492 RepID=A0ABS6MQU7_9GAMM|nr:DNA translocase FtsK [Pseudomonas aromaticivorans]MBV2131188.1 DNA translocase FtsK 4TM domain-containing protein [Pseudomonas aromaticivorans]